MLVLDKLLARCKAKGSKVLLFSQMTRLLDILEDYCQWRQFKYLRLDGSSGQKDRDAAVDAFQNPDGDTFLFLLSTRAGGLGLTLTAADTVIFYDLDWNPHVDLQAEDRAHRIGQTKQVTIFRLITENAIDEKIQERAAKKLQLDKVIIHQQRRLLAGESGIPQVDRAKVMKEKGSDYLEAIEHGINDIMKKQSPPPQGGLEIDVEKLIQEGEERAKTVENMFQNSTLEDLLTHKSTAPDTSMLIDESEVELSDSADTEPTGRRRYKRTTRSSSMFKDLTEAASGGPQDSPQKDKDADYEPPSGPEEDEDETPMTPEPQLSRMRIPTRPPRKQPYLDFQFPDKRLREVLDKKHRFERKVTNFVFPALTKFAKVRPNAPLGEEKSAALLDLAAAPKMEALVSPIVEKLDLAAIPTSNASLQRFLQEQRLIDAGKGFASCLLSTACLTSRLATMPTAEDERDRKRLSGHRFAKWTRKEFSFFLTALAIYDKDDFDAISSFVVSKSPEEIRQYSEVFWTRYHEVEGMSTASNI